MNTLLTMRLRPSYLLFLVTLVSLGACKKDEEPAVDLGYGYYPTVVGSWVEYQVDSVYREDAVPRYDSVSYRLRQTIESAYLDAEGRQAFRVQRAVQDTAGNWVIRDVWTTTANGITAELMEENKRRQKLSFPVRLSREWDVNVYNTDRELEVGYTEVDVPWSVNGLSFERTALVKNTVPANAVERRDWEERYAHGVGMVYKRWVETDTQSGEVTGFFLTMTAVAYGQN
ncbi:MAG: hypothetical protein MUE88_04480 [Flavobacteriales bacterium]|nr:hypothetical protein [Flavobacteriales bacterium]